MAIPASDRPLETLRDEVVERLIVNYGHGRLSLEAFERRLDDAFAAERHEALCALVADLEPSPEDARRGHGAAAPAVGPRREDRDSAESLVAIFGGSERKGAWRVPAELRVLTLFGGTELDFSQATFTSPTTRIQVLCLFGGIDIRVPEGVPVTTRVVAVFGGAGNRTPECDDPQAPRLVVEGLVMFGGVDAKLRRSTREQARQRAERYRAGLLREPG